MKQQKLMDIKGWISEDSSLYGEDEAALRSENNGGSELPLSPVQGVRSVRSSQPEMIAKNMAKGSLSAESNSTSLQRDSSRTSGGALPSSNEVAGAQVSPTDLVSNETGLGCREIERFRGVRAARQQTETIDEFMARLPVDKPVSASVGPWLWVGNPLTPPKQQRNGRKLDEAALLREGLARLRTFATQTDQGKTCNKTALQKQLRDDIVSLGAKHGITAGKWMLFPSIRDLSDVWRKVAEATAGGKLGQCSKVGTFEHGRSNQLICVYTYDCRDVEDIRRVLKNLQEIQLARGIIYYKCDAYTYLDIDSKNPGNFRASLVSNTAFNSAWGKAYRYFSLKPTYLTAIAILELGNVVCASAQSSNAVILGRAVCGLGGAWVVSGSFIIIALTVKPQLRAAYIGVLGVTFGCSSVIGPLLGGALVEALSWRWCFWINLPIGAVAAGIIILIFTQPPTVTPPQVSFKGKLVHMDVNGGVLVSGALSCWVLAMHWAGIYAWSSANVVASLVGSAGMTTLFVVNEKLMGSKVMLQARVLKKWNITSNSLFAFFLAGVYFPMLYTLPIQFQSVNNDSAVESGIRLIPLVLGISLCSLISNMVFTWWRNYNFLLVVGAFTGTVSVSVIYTFDEHTPLANWIGPEILAAAGIGISLRVPMIANQAEVGIEDISAVTSMSLFAENVGTTLFVAASEAAFANGLINGPRSYLPDTNPMEVVNTGVTQLRSSFPPAQLRSVLAAYLEACRDSHIIPIACGSAAALLSLMTASPSIKKGFWHWFQKPHIG